MAETAELSIWERLAQPFTGDDVKQRVQAATKKKGDDNKYPADTKGMLVDYIDARSVMNRLDEVVGPACWQDEYTTLTEKPWVVRCRLGILVDGVWVWKEDVGYSNDPKKDTDDNEPSKAAHSDAFKRTAIKWGIGRHLYDSEPRWVPIDTYGKPIPQKNAESGSGRASTAPQADEGEAPQPQVASPVTKAAVDSLCVRAKRRGTLEQFKAKVMELAGVESFTYEVWEFRLNDEQRALAEQVALEFPTDEEGSQDGQPDDGGQGT